MDTKLTFAEKYNWWSKDTKNISFETKLSYVLTRWSSEELFFVFKNINEESLQKAYNLVKNDNFSLKTRRRAAITQLLKYKANNEL